ncbi:unnamed protein product [Malus baccata var. baccata]
MIRMMIGDEKLNFCGCVDRREIPLLLLSQPLFRRPTQNGLHHHPHTHPSQDPDKRYIRPLFHVPRRRSQARRPLSPRHRCQFVRQKGTGPSALYQEACHQAHQGLERTLQMVRDEEV